MKHPALKGEVSLNKMLRQIEPRLRRTDIMFNSFSSCVPNASEEFSWTPEMSVSEIISQPRMFVQKFKGTVPLKQLKSFADTHSNWQLNKQVDMINSNMELVDFTSMLDSNFSDKPFTINFDSIKLEGIHSIFGFPDKMESILSEGMFKTFQIHFISPQNIAHAKSVNLVPRAATSSRDIQEFKFYKEDGNSSLGLKAEVSLPLM